MRSLALAKVITGADFFSFELALMTISCSSPAVHPTEAVEAAGTTAYVRGGFCLRDRVDIVKQIEASHDRVRIDLQDGEEAQPAVDYANLENRKTDIGRVLVHNFGKGFVGWSPNLCLEHTDFLRVRRTIATSIAADLSKRTRLSAEMDKKYGSSN